MTTVRFSVLRHSLKRRGQKSDLDYRRILFCDDAKRRSFTFNRWCATKTYRQGLLLQHMGNEYFANALQVQPGFRHLPGYFRQNAIDVLHHFPLLEEIRLFDAHGLANQFKKVDDLEGRCGFMRAELAMAAW